MKKWEKNYRKELDKVIPTLSFGQFMLLADGIDQRLMQDLNKEGLIEALVFIEKLKVKKKKKALDSLEYPKMPEDEKTPENNTEAKKDLLRSEISEAVDKLLELMNKDLNTEEEAMKFAAQVVYGYEERDIRK